MTISIVAPAQKTWEEIAKELQQISNSERVYISASWSSDNGLSTLFAHFDRTCRMCDSVDEMYAHARLIGNKNLGINGVVAVASVTIQGPGGEA